VSTYLSFVVFCVVLAVAPGPDTLLTLRSTVAGGRARGLWTMAGISTAGALQGVLAATGLGAAIEHARPVFLVIRWAGVVYLVYLGVMALVAAARDRGDGWSLGSAGRGWTPVGAYRQGFLCNATNPKVLAFNLAVLPQFAGDQAGIVSLLVYALTLTVVGAVVLFAVVAAAGVAQRLVKQARVRRGIDGAAGVVFIGFATALAIDS
jgi:threonine/homoserine/homoserine lactone efflux protein